MSKTPAGCGIGDVFSPRAVTYNGTCPHWGSIGASASRTFPTICMYMCSVSRVGRHASYGSSGQASSFEVGASMRLSGLSQPPVVPTIVD